MATLQKFVGMCGQVTTRPITHKISKRNICQESTRDIGSSEMDQQPPDAVNDDD